MSTQALSAAQAKMRAAGVNETAVAIFTAYYRQLEEGSTGIIPESSIEPVPDLARYEDLAGSDDDRDALAQTAVIRLNGGLGTSMGLSRAKSLLPVRDGLTFLDLIARQVLWARERYQVRLPLVLLHSFSTRDDSLAALAGYDLQVGGLPLDMMQSQEPKLLVDDLSPVSWPADPRLEWCPPGHGDIYPTLLESGLLDALLQEGFRYACVANSDNLGAAPSARLAGWFARCGAAFAAEVTPRTPMDVKGGHSARRRSDGRLVLRETAQTTPDDMRFFTDPAVHPYASTNNLWFDLAQLRQTLSERNGVLGLALIRNQKTVDPRDPGTPAVYQVESAMGAAIECFDQATAIVVPRSRFVPVKSTNELLLLRSDAYRLDDSWVPRATVSPMPVVTLGGAYRNLADYEERLPYPPSLTRARSLSVQGDWRFGKGVVVEGDVVLGEDGGSVPDQTVLKG
ncbi:MAG: UTP--glucose-1-phosphate uridylyltransferase [Actinomycetia bacterium]|nr:UTP--glucose-1-phosphate uridylyltransferase [Actinomycetes bacterium]